MSGFVLLNLGNDKTSVRKQEKLISGDWQGTMYILHQDVRYLAEGKRYVKVVRRTLSGQLDDQRTLGKCDVCCDVFSLI